MKNNLVLILIGVVLGVAGICGYLTLSGESTSMAEESDGLFINIHTGSGDNATNHRLVMALRTAAMAAESGRDVYVLFDTSGIDHVVQGAEDVTFITEDGTVRSVQMLIDEALAAGVTIAACPMCLNSKGYTPEDVQEGVIIHSVDKFFDFTDGRVISLSY